MKQSKIPYIHVVIKPSQYQLFKAQLMYPYRDTYSFYHIN